jgi:two-component system phosphate regulon sensor histidine kinase PhoR
MTAEASVPASDSFNAPSGAAESYTILVVDDEIGIRKGCQRVLAAEGYQVLLAETAEQGLEQLQANSDVDLALVDIRMPGMGGLGFLAAAEEVAPETVCIVITAYASIDTAMEATRRGAYEFLTKPFTPDQLLRVVDKGLKHVRLVRERNRLRNERERRLLELATEKGRLRTVLNGMADGVLVCNTDNQLVLHNPAALRVLPGHREEAMVSNLSEVLAPPELLQLIEEARQSGKHLSKEIRLTHLPEDGWLLADVAPVTDERTGQFLGTVTVLRDISELKRVEQVKAQFVNMVAHELRAPLAAIDGYLSVLHRGLVPDPEKQQEIIQRCRDRQKALLDLVNDLLDMARLEAGTVRREIAPQALHEVVEATAELMQPLAEEKGVTIQTHVPENLPPVEADREELIRLLSNLVSNGIKYNRPQGRVSISGEQDGPYVKVSVTDTGVGISEEGLKRLFSEFFREKTPETRYVTGTGLGLSIVKRIVDSYHGRVEAQSTPGEGSTFTVWLPSQPH